MPWVIPKAGAPLPPLPFPCSASLMGTVGGDHERGYPALLFLTRRSHKISAVKSRDRAGEGASKGAKLNTTHEPCLVCVCVWTARQSRMLLVERDCRFESLGSTRSFPVLLLLRQLSAGELVNKPGGQSFGESWQGLPCMCTGVCVRVCVHVCAPLCKRCHGMLGLG